MNYIIGVIMMKIVILNNKNYYVIKNKNMGEGSKICRSFRMCLSLNDYHCVTS